MSDDTATVSSRSLALRFGVALPLLAGSLIAAAAYAPFLQAARDGLVRATAATAGALLPLSGWSVERDGRVLRAPGERAVQVATDCDALPVALLFLAAVVVTPTAWRQKLFFGLLGVGLLFLVNQVRLGHLLHLSGGRDPETFRSAHETWWPAGLVLFAGAMYLIWASRQVQRA